MPKIVVLVSYSIIVKTTLFQIFFLIVYMKLNELRKFHIILILLLILEFKSPQLIPVQLFHVNVSFKCQRNMLGSSSVTCPFTAFCKKSFTVTASRLWNVLPFNTKLQIRLLVSRLRSWTLCGGACRGSVAGWVYYSTRG